MRHTEQGADVDVVQVHEVPEVVELCTSRSCMISVSVSSSSVGGKS